MLARTLAEAVGSRKRGPTGGLRAVQVAAAVQMRRLSLADAVALPKAARALLSFRPPHVGEGGSSWVLLFCYCPILLCLLKAMS